MAAIEAPLLDLTETVVGFARTLRAAGIEAGTDRVQAMLLALRNLDVMSGHDAYWAGRLTLCAGPVDVGKYDAAFVAYFGSRELGPPLQGALSLTMKLESVATADNQAIGADEQLEINPTTTAASDVDVLRSKDVATLTDSERAEVRRLLARLDPRGPSRRSLRYAPSHRGQIDTRRTVRAMLRRGGEIDTILMRRHRERPRRIVELIDVSGSMELYADSHLRFAHVLTRRRPDVEVFTIGTRLTRVTRQMSARDPDSALRAVGAAVPDWSGGTRLGDLLKAFLDRWGQRGTARGAVVVIASDGWERGEVTLLGEQMARLHRLAHSVIWVNPHAGKDGFAPATAGMSAALPHVDALVAGHNVAAFEALAQRLSQTATVVRQQARAVPVDLSQARDNPQRGGARA
ncbi:MAG: vWA domain-containing protein [Sporichthyaceae bacterium]